LAEGQLFLTNRQLGLPVALGGDANRWRRNRRGATASMALQPRGVDFPALPV